MSEGQGDAVEYSPELSLATSQPHHPIARHHGDDWQTALPELGVVCYSENWRRVVFTGLAGLSCGLVL